MANKYSYPISLVFVAVAFFFLGELCASLVSVVTKEEATIGAMMRLERKLVKCIGQGGKVPHTVEELVASGICDEEECRDAWGRMFEMMPEGDGKIRLTSFGDPAIQKLDPGIKFTLSRIISIQSSLSRVCRPVHKESQSVHDVEVAIKSLTLASKRYDAMNVVDVFGDIYNRANKRLDENGFYGIGLHLVDTNTDVDTLSVTIDVPELTIFQTFEFVAQRFGWTVEYNGGGVFVRGKHMEEARRRKGRNSGGCNNDKQCR